MPNCKNFNRLGLIIDQIQNAIVADANAIAIVPLKLLDTVRTRVAFQLKKSSGDSVAYLFGKSVEFLFRGATKDKRVGHDVLFGFAGGQVFTQRTSRFGPTLLDGGDIEQVFAKLFVL